MKKITHTQYISFRNIVADCGLNPLTDINHDLEVCSLIIGCQLLPDYEMPDESDFMTMLIYNSETHHMTVDRVKIIWRSECSFFIFTTEQGYSFTSHDTQKMFAVAVFTD